MLTNLTFGHVKTDTSIKIRSLMDRFNILSDMSNELYQNSMPNMFSKRFKWLSPFNMTQRTEYVNQAPIMVAMLNRVKTANGKTLWEQFDKEGNWIGEEALPDETLLSFRLKTDGIRDRSHGDYANPLKIKKHVIGRGAAQFRTWMAEGFAQRFEDDKYDENLGINRKGRYKSLSPYFKQTGVIGGMADMFIETAKRLVFTDGDIEILINVEEFTESDAANMRKVLQEMAIYVGVTSFTMAISMMSKLDIEEDEKGKRVFKGLANYLVNQGNRLETDLVFYLSPVEFRKLLRDPIPATTLIKDTQEWIWAVGGFIGGHDIYETGIYSGESKLAKKTMKMLPLGTQINRVVTATQIQY